MLVVLLILCVDLSSLFAVSETTKDRNPELIEGQWKSVPFQQTQSFYLLKTGEVAAGNTVSIRTEATKGKAVISVGTQSDVRNNHKRKITLEVSRTFVDIFEIKLDITSTIYIGIEPSVADAACRAKYTIVKCDPSRTAIAEGDRLTVPVQGQRCFYIFETRNEVATESTITIYAKATTGKLDIFAGTHSNVRVIHADMANLDAAGISEGKLQFTISAASTIYIGVKPARPGAGCELHYTTTKLTTKRGTTARVTSTKTGD